MDLQNRYFAVFLREGLDWEGTSFGADGRVGDGDKRFQDMR